MYENGFSEGYAIGRDTANYNNNGWGFGGDGAWWILALLFLGYGNGGFGGFGGGYNNGFYGFELGKVATTNDIASGFNNSAVLSSLNDLKLGQSDLQQTLCQGFNGVNTAILQSANATERGFAQTNYNLQDCCCKLERGIDSINFNAQKNTCDIIRAGQDNTQRIIDLFTSDKIDSLNRELTLAQGQLSQNAQTANIISALRPTPVPAFPASNLYGYCYCNNGCGCGL